MFPDAVENNAVRFCLKKRREHFIWAGCLAGFHVVLEGLWWPRAIEDRLIKSLPESPNERDSQRRSQLRFLSLR